MTTLYAMIRPAAITAKRAEIAKNKHEDFDYYLRTLNKIHTLVDMHEALPPDMVKKVIDTIEREGGQCSKKVLYETSCLMHPDRGDGMLHAVSVLGQIKFSYFSDVIGTPMNANQIKPLNDFLQRHMSQSQDAKISTRGTKVSTEKSVLLLSLRIALLFLRAPFKFAIRCGVLCF